MKISIDKYFVKVIVAFALFIFGLLLLAGCGGGGAYRSSDPKLTGEYVPNYYDKLDSVRRWPVKDLTYRITGGDSSVPLIDQPEQARKGFIAWTPTLSGLMTLTETTTSPDIEVTFVSPNEFTQPGRVGETGFTYVGGARQWKVTLKISRSLIPILQEKVATHEMGHALGIMGHSPYFPDIMYPKIASFAGITTRDHNTLRKIYDADGDGRKVYPPGYTETVCGLTIDDLKE